MTTSESIGRLKAGYYNGSAYNAGSNPGGLADGGHRTNFAPALEDVGIAADYVGTKSYYETKLVTAATYTLLEEDSGKHVVFSRATPILITVPTGLTAGWNVVGVQGGAGQLTIQAAQGLTIGEADGLRKTAQQYAQFGLVIGADAVAYLAGDLAS